MNEKGIIEKLGFHPSPWSVIDSSPENSQEENEIHDCNGEEVLGVSEWLRVDDNDYQLMSVAPEMLEALIYFCNRVDNGTIRSKTTYNMYISIIEKATEKTWSEIKVKL